jgi:hypothetical protein
MEGCYRGQHSQVLGGGSKTTWCTKISDSGDSHWRLERLERCGCRPDTLIALHLTSAHTAPAEGEATLPIGSAICPTVATIVECMSGNN